MLETIGTQWNMLAAAHAGAGDYDRAIEAFGRGTVLAHAKGNLIAAYGASYGQAMYLLVQGRLNEADELCRLAIARAEREGHGDFPAAGSLYVAMARIKLERNHLDKAEAYLDTGLRVARPGGFSEVVRTGRHLRAHLAAARGDLDAAADIFLETERIVNAIDNAYVAGELNWEWARLCLKAGDLATAREKLHILEEKSAATQHANLLFWQRWLFPRLLCEEERYEEALTALNDSIPCARTVRSNGELIRLLALQAAVVDALGERMPARSALREALVLGAPGGYIWRWLESSPRIVPLLRELRDHRVTSKAYYPYLDSVLDAFRDAGRYTGRYARRSADEEPARTLSGELLDPLTPRELEVMRLIGEGYSNPEIASELVVTVNTIKKHTSNIYGKLGVSSRTQAVARAHELKLL
jgi:LuxR family maltose regulon positive regulatory protein